MTDNEQEDERRAALVAYLSSGYRGRSPLSQAEIAHLKLAGLASQSAVSRAYNRAIRYGYLKDAAPDLLVERLKRDEVFSHVAHLADMVDFKDRLAASAKAEGWPRIPHVHGIPVYLDLKESLEKRRRLTRAFYGFAGSIVYGLIRDCRRIGVSWGETVSNVVSAIDEQAPRNPDKVRRIEAVVPLIGEPPAGVTSEFSSTLLAERLLRAIPHDSQATERLTLRYVHSFVSDGLAKRYDARDLEVGREAALAYYRDVSSYGKIFGPGTDGGAVPLVQSLDAIVTSLSWDETPWGIRTLEAEGEGGVAPSKTSDMLPDDAQILTAVKQIATGDICGVLLPYAGADPDRLDELQHRWTGIKPAQLAQLAAQAWERGQPGVVVVAFGERKVQTTLAALRAGYINHLVVGERLAQGISRALAKPRRQKRRSVAQLKSDS
jgi:hypothetical protein